MNKYRNVLLAFCVIMISVIAGLYVMFSRGPKAAAELQENIRIVDITRGRLALTFPEVPFYDGSVAIDYRALIIHGETLLLRYDKGHPNGLFFHSGCSKYDDQGEETLREEYVRVGTNSRIGDGIYFEHSKGATAEEVCMIRADGHQIDVGSVTARSLEIGHAQAPFVKLKFPKRTQIKMEVVQSRPLNLITINWL